jgi:indolepyruvate ferredoxin oxidoreductase beta subunit
MMQTKCDIILAGVGGQGVLSLSSVIAYAGLLEGLAVKQSEVHGMAQRGGAVSAHLRIANRPIASDLIGNGRADLIISMEPLESLRYLPFLSTQGALITSTAPFINIVNYPDIDLVMKQVDSLPSAIRVDSDDLAREAGSMKAANMVLVGAASHHVPIPSATMERCIENLFARKGKIVVGINIRAYRLGREASKRSSTAGPRSCHE